MLVAEDLKVFRAELDRNLRAASEDCIFNGGLQIDLERVAKFVGLGLAQQIAIGAAGIHLVVAHAVFLKVGEDFFQRLLADAPDAPGGEVHLVVAGDISRFLE